MDIISVSNLSKKFGNFEAVNGISFAVAKGDIFAFLGPNGAGKTTTIKMLTTLLHPSGGQISLNGHDPMADQESARRSFGIVFQDPSLDDELTAYENMDFHARLYSVPKDKREERIRSLLNFVELWERKDELAKNFSGGMKRRLEIARGLIHHPKILFLDEPTIGLDPQTRNNLWSYIKKVNNEEEMTVFLTTHYMEEAEKVATKVGVIDHGRILAIGSPEEIKQQNDSATLEEAFLKMTGRQVREETAGSIEQMRQARRLWGRSR
jgi:ABC-2 type transport system ATP-binding protein